MHRGVGCTIPNCEHDKSCWLAASRSCRLVLFRCAPKTETNCQAIHQCAFIVIRARIVVKSHASSVQLNLFDSQYKPSVNASRKLVAHNVSISSMRSSDAMNFSPNVHCPVHCDRNCLENSFGHGVCTVYAQRTQSVNYRFIPQATHTQQLFTLSANVWGKEMWLKWRVHPSGRIHCK